MTETVGRTAVSSPSPRHMRKRRFLGDIPPSHLPAVQTSASLSSSEPPLERVPNPPESVDHAAEVAPASVSADRGKGPTKATLRQKRMVALIIVILVSISIPLLVLTLMFTG